MNHYSQEEFMSKWMGIGMWISSWQRAATTKGSLSRVTKQYFFCFSRNSRKRRRAEKENLKIQWSSFYAASSWWFAIKTTQHFPFVAPAIFPLVRVTEVSGENTQEILFFSSFSIKKNFSFCAFTKIKIGKIVWRFSFPWENSKKLQEIVDF
jgi:hypothetical protein